MNEWVTDGWIDGVQEEGKQGVPLGAGAMWSQLGVTAVRDKDSIGRGL